MNSSGEEEYRYLTVGELGKGGMGTVWEMHDTALNRRIAFKQLHTELVGIKAIEEYFLNEGRILARLEHPGIVPIHEFDVSSEDGACYYTMAKVRGESLQSILDGLKNRNKATLLRWNLVRLMGAFSQLCETLAFAHEQGILHRDLKPDNVMLGHFGEVFLVDWGIAKEVGKDTANPALEEHLRISQTRLSNGSTSLFAMSENVYGTLGYMSPEAASGTDSYTDGGSDIFSLGAILYQILTLRPPYQGKDPAKILEVAKRGEIYPVNKVEGIKPHLPGGKVPDALAAITMMALSKNREDRYETAQDLRRDIEAFLQGRTPRAQEAGAFQMLQTFVRRNPGMIIVWTIAIVTILSVLTSGLVENYRNRVEAEYMRDLAVEKKKAFLEERSASNADRNEAAPRFAQLAWDRLNIGDISRAENLANAALDFGGGDDSIAKSHLVLGLVKVIRGFPQLANYHWEKAESGPFLNNLKNNLESDQPISWPDLLEKSGLHALALRQLDHDPKKQFEKLHSLLEKHWDNQLWELSNTNLDRSGYYRLVLKKGIKSNELEYLRGWPIHHLILNDIPVADLGRLTDLPVLRILELGPGHLAYDLSPLAELSKLNSLTVSRIAESPEFAFDLTPLGSLSRLDSLTIDSNVISLGPIRRLGLSKLSTRKLIRNSSLLPLRGMPLRELTIENPTNLDALRGMPLEVFRPGARATGYTLNEIALLINLPISELRFEGNVRDEINRLSQSKTLTAIETDVLHNLRTWRNSTIKCLHLKGSYHSLTELDHTPVSKLELSSTTDKATQIRPVLYPLLRSSQLSELNLPDEGNSELSEFHIHLESPLLAKCLAQQDWLGANLEWKRIGRRYSKHLALNEIADEWLPILKKHIDDAEKGIPSETWHPRVNFENHSYQWIKTPMTRAEAAEFANTLGGYLVRIDSEEEWLFAGNNLGIPQDSTSVWSGGSNRIWVGIADAETTKYISPLSENIQPQYEPAIYLSQAAPVVDLSPPGAQWSFIVEWDYPVPPQLHLHPRIRFNEVSMPPL
ncbi:MAG: protein kinase [Verrucomicrobiales bacterium]|nr:protein kinase [Verrucomicrobiales bacterium]